MLKTLPLFAFLLSLFFASPALADETKYFGSVQGNILKRISYEDAEGKHLVLLTHTGIFQTKPDPEMICTNGDLYAYGFDVLDDSLMPTFTMHDFVHDCETSETLEFSRDSPVITDLDKNGLSEVWIVYYVGCRGDVSPVGMKLLMYEKGKKHAMRGLTFVHVDDLDLGGTYKEDANFLKAPKVIRQFADKLWKKNMRQ